MRKPAELIRKQDPLKINQALLKQATSDEVHIVVSIPKQRAYLMLSEQIAIDGPVSSGKHGHSSPTGHFTVLEKDPNHHSTLYGDFRDSSGRIVRAGVSARIDSAPSGTHFVGAEMKWFLRRRRDAHRHPTGISRLARLHSRVCGRREIILRPCQNRDAGRCGRLLKTLTISHVKWRLSSAAIQSYLHVRTRAPTGR